MPSPIGLCYIISERGNSGGKSIKKDGKVASKNEEFIRMYRTMLTIRRFDERASQEVRNGAVPGLVHPYIGQEAVATGVCGALIEGDRIVSNHRGHGHLIAKGADVRRM